jgi:Flp pilus assembly protein TadD
MAKVCPKCNADNSDLAKYCDQCAAPISPEAEAELAARGSRAGTAAGGNAVVNWVGIIVVLAIIGAGGWLLFASHPPKPGAMPAGGEPGGAEMQNPHAQPGAAGMGGDIMQQIDGAKAALDKDPLDTQSLASLYQMYGMIGRQQQVRPYLDKAYEALVQKRGELGAKAPQVLEAIVFAAMSGQDIDGATTVLLKYQPLDPQNTSVLNLLGDVYFDANRPEEAIKWYTLYLDQAKPEVAGETYWRVRTDRASMYLTSGKPVDGKDSVQLAISELQYITQQTPAMWNAWFNLGLAYSTAKRKDQAKAAWQKALPLAGGEEEKWRVEAELAKLDGKEPPPPPDSPHGGMGGGGMDRGGMENPHGAGGGQPGGGV